MKALAATSFALITLFAAGMESSAQLAPQSPPSVGGISTAYPAAVAVISDTHMGFGETDAGEWNPLEDFRWADEFVLFLNQIDRMSQNRVTLVLAGDTFELWQSDTPDCRAAAPTLGCSEDEAVARIKRILTAHRVELQALGTFASHPANRLIFIPGNHDAAI